MEPTRVTLVPHTHWDREWYDPFAVFSERLVAMMDTLLDLADRGFPHFHLDGQTAMIDDYLERRPERAGDVARHVREGRLSAGPWFTQMDEFLTSGESHIRNLERGLARARELGAAMEIGYMPDQFGHIGQMPQILRANGIERAVVWRGVPAVIDKDVFWWEAPDGSRVLTEYMAFGYFNAETDDDHSFDEIEDPAELADAMEHTVERQRAFMASDRMLVMLGYDHSGPEAAFPARLDAARPMLRSVEPSLGGLAEHLGAQRLSDGVPTWRGELRSSARAHLLPNVVSARAYQKRERGRVEDLVERVAEPLAALVPGFPWPTTTFDRIWQLLLWNGAHDSACGCSHDQVAHDVDARSAEARHHAETIVADALEALGAQMTEPGVLRWNPSPFERDGVPALGWRVDTAGREPAEVPVSLRVVDAGVEADGVPILLFDEPDVGDLYTYCYAQEGQRPSPPDRVELRGHEVTASWDGLTVAARVTRRTGEHLLRIEGVIHNERPDHRLRLHVGLDHAGGVDRSLAGAPFELVQRPLIGEGSSDEAASPTWPARGLVFAGGTAIFHDGVFEYEVVDDRELAVTMLRCVGTISRSGLATRPWAAGPDVPTPDAQMIGDSAFSLGVWAGATSKDLLAERERFAIPLAEAAATGGGSLPLTGTLLDLAVEGGAQLSSVRRVDGRVEVRVWNARQDGSATATVGRATRVLGPARIETVPVDLTTPAPG